ncbi:collagen alpha-1(XX) chain precursor, partial [Daubentonia madagascariensis]
GPPGLKGEKGPWSPRLAAGQPWESQPPWTKGAARPKGERGEKEEPWSHATIHQLVCQASYVLKFDSVLYENTRPLTPLLEEKVEPGGPGPLGPAWRSEAPLPGEWGMVATALRMEGSLELPGRWQPW